MTRSAPSRIGAVAAAAAVGAALCAAGAVPAAALLPAGGDGAHPTLAHNRVLARHEVHRLLADRRLPASARRLHGTPPRGLRRPALTSTGTQVHAHPVFVHTSLPLSRLVSWLRDHHPAGHLRGDTTGSGTDHGRVVSRYASYDDRDSRAYAQPELSYSVIRAHDGGTLWRVDADALVVDPRPVHDHPRHPLRVTSTTGCPHSDRGKDGVRNPGSGLNRHLAPSARATGATVCVYAGYNRAHGHAPFTLERQATVGPRAARALGAGAHRVSLAHLDGVAYGCPLDDGSVTVVDLTYAHRPDVDLWYARTGCTSLSNGHVVSGDAGRGGAAFYRELRRVS